jgi:hypothetical protein
MSSLVFEIVGAQAPPTAATPTVSFRLRIREHNAERVDALVLRAQVQIEPRKRHYSATEERRMVELFGEPHRWGDTLHTVLWTHIAASVPSFVGETEIDLPAPCSYDFDVASNKYFDALEDGEIPLLFLFSGTIFTAAEGRMQVARISWDREAAYRLPVSVYRAAIDLHFPNSAWIRVRKDVFNELYAFKTGGFHPTWDQALEALLGAAAAPTAVEPEGRR